MLFKVVVHGDTMCGWCFIGMRSLYRAIEIFTETHPDACFDISFQSFILYPNLVKGTPKTDLIAKASSAYRANMEAAISHIRALGLPLGVVLNSDFLHGTTGSSIDSHRLLALVRRRCGPAAVVRLVDAIFSSIFEYNQDVANLAVLAKLAADITPFGTPVRPEDRLNLGMSEREILRWLHGDEFRADMAAYMKLPAGIQATPAFAIQGKYLVGGYQDPSVFVTLFERIEAQGGPSP